MDRFDRISADPAIVNGKPCIRGTRITVRRVLEAVALYPDRAELRRQYPELNDEDKGATFLQGYLRRCLGIACAKWLRMRFRPSVLVKARPKRTRRESRNCLPHESRCAP